MTAASSGIVLPTTPTFGAAAKTSLGLSTVLSVSLPRLKTRQRTAATITAGNSFRNWKDSTQNPITKNSPFSQQNSRPQHLDRKNSGALARPAR